MLLYDPKIINLDYRKCMNYIKLKVGKFEHPYSYLPEITIINILMYIP